MAIPILHPLFSLMASLTRQELARQIAYLKAENQILRARLPKQIVTTAKERRILLRAGRKLGAKLKDLISIVSYQTFRRWVRESGAATPLSKSKRTPGRPRTDAEVQAIILKFARENGWGLTRILGELKKLGITTVSRTTVKNILKAHGLEPGPERGAGTWDEFLVRHAETLWQCDFLATKAVTATGVKDLFLLVFLHIGSRCLFVSPATYNPDAAWVSQQARNFLMSDLVPDAQPGEPSRFMICDNDTKFTAAFVELLKSSDINVLRTAIRSPNQNAFVERVIQTLRRECLDHFVIVGRRHTNLLVRKFVGWYHRSRPHQGLDNRPPVQTLPIEEWTQPKLNDVVCTSELGGLLNSYHRRAA